MHASSPTLRIRWLGPALLLALTVVPIIAGMARLMWIATGTLRPDSARFAAGPTPLVLHILSTSAFCVVGAFQFTSSLRNRWPGWHRAAGRLQVPAGLAASISGLWMVLFYPPGVNDGALLMVIRLAAGAAMTASILLGIAAICRRDFVDHSAWMMRGYAIGMGAGTQVVVFLAWALLGGATNEGSRALLMGAGWAVNLCVAELIIRRRQAANAGVTDMSAPRRAIVVVGRAIPLMLTLLLLAACASPLPQTGGSLASYSGLAAIRSGRTQALARTDKVALVNARTVRIAPVTFADAAGMHATPGQRALIANAMERTLCHDLSARFEVVAASEKADLTIRTSVTRIKPTDTGAAVLSLLVTMALPAPRLPVGLGGFAAEAEALGPEGDQAAAMIWSQDADVFGSRRASPIADAYDLSSRFAHDLSKLLAAEREDIPLDGQAVNPVCAQYGKAPGFSAAVAGLFGAPPEWTDGKQPPV